MSKMSVYDECVGVDVWRHGATRQTVRFCDVEKWDELADIPGTIVACDAHLSGDTTYDGWLFYDMNGNAYFPEDFGAELIYDPDDDDEEDMRGE